MADRTLKATLFLPAARKDLQKLPPKVRGEIGQALYIAQLGRQALNVKIMKGFGGGAVLEVVEDFNTDTFRAVYTVRFEQAIVVLHVFQKKSKRGGEMTQQDKELVRRRLRDAEEIYEDWLAHRGKGEFK